MADEVKKTKCDCGHVAYASGCSTGFGKDADGKTWCFDCIGKMDRDRLKKAKPGDRFDFYLVDRDGKWFVTNWPGSMSIETSEPRQGSHNLAGIRLDTWFSFGGLKFHGVCYGHFSQICHIQCVKRWW